MKSCPAPVELERAYWTQDPLMRSHADGCRRCGHAWTEIASLAEAARELEVPAPSAERREEIRTALLAKRQQVPEPTRLRWRWSFAMPLAAAAAAAIVVGWWPRGRIPPAPTVAQRGSVLAHEGARYLVASPQPDEIVRLTEGTLTVEVRPLQPGERFRVLTGDGEVEVKGTAFDVTAHADHLVAVRVLHGRVEVRGPGTATVLQAGESWQAPTATLEVVPETPPTPRRTHSASPPPASLAPESPPAPIQPKASGPRSPGQQAFDEGWHAIRRGDFQQAAQAFEQAAIAGRGTRLEEDASYWRAVALARAGEATRAAGAFEAFLASYSSSSRAGEVSVMLGWILFERGDHQGAARRFRTAVADPSARVRKSAAEGLTAIERAARQEHSVPTSQP